MRKNGWMLASVLMLAIPVSWVFAQKLKEPWKSLDRNADLTGYCVTGKMPVPNGMLEILQDPVFEKPNWQDLVDPLLADYDKLKKAVLRFKRNDGVTIELRKLGSPEAKFVKNRICSGSLKFFLIEINYFSGSGIFSGPETFIIEIKGDQLSLVQEEYHGKIGELNLLENVRTGWWLSPKIAFGCHDILQMFCRPDYRDINNISDELNPNDHKLTYRRYRFDGTKWIVSEKTGRGFWENESRPAESFFPK
jgi:hypothetical protein